MTRLLLIDDDEKLSAPLAEYCARFDLTLDAVTHPREGLKRLRGGDYALVILDVMLPEMDGFEVCRQIRRDSQIPIIMLTARGDVTDKIVGLELGADDYLPKPFDPRELVARIQTVLKRVNTAAESGAQSSDDDASVLKFGDLVIDTRTRIVTVKGTTVELTTMEYQLLTMMSESPGKDFSRDQIINVLKGTDVELFTRSVDILVSRLRSKLKPLKLIKTVYGSGYAFTGVRE